MFKYERLALFCHYCSLLRHDLRHCAQYFGATKNGEEAECQYGDWMKATGSQARSPNSQGRYRDEVERASEEETTRSQQGRSRASVEDDGAGRAAVARVSMAPQVEGTAENQGSCPESSQPNSVIQGEKVSAMEGMDGPMSGDVDQSPGMAGLRVFTGPLNQMENGPMSQFEDSGLLNQIEDNGPHKVVKQSRWSRLTRMDLGPVDLFKEGAKSILGREAASAFSRTCLTKEMSRQRRKPSLRKVLKFLKWRGCYNTLAESNEDVKLELPRAWEPLDSSKPSQISKGTSS